MSDENNTKSKSWVHYGGARNAKLKMIDNIGNHSKTEIELFRKCQESLNMFFGHKSPLVVGSADIYYIPARLMKTASMLARIYAKVFTLNTVSISEMSKSIVKGIGIAKMIFHVLVLVLRQQPKYWYWYC